MPTETGRRAPEDAPMVTSGGTPATTQDVVPSDAGSKGAELTQVALVGDADHSALVTTDSIRRAIAEARTLFDSRRARDLAIGVEIFAKKALLSRDLLLEAAEVRVLAERAVGLKLVSMEKSEGGRPTGNLSSHATGLQTLKELGISRNQSSNWQKIAALPADALKRHFEKHRMSGQPVTTSGVVRLVEQRDERVQLRHARAAAGDRRSRVAVAEITGVAPETSAHPEQVSRKSPTKTAESPGRDDVLADPPDIELGTRPRATEIDGGDDITEQQQTVVGENTYVAADTDVAVMGDDPKEHETKAISEVAPSRSRRSRRSRVELVRTQVRELRDEVLGLRVPEMRDVLLDVEALAIAIRERVQDWEGDETAVLDTAADMCAANEGVHA